MMDNSTLLAREQLSLVYSPIQSVEALVECALRLQAESLSSRDRNPENITDQYGGRGNHIDGDFREQILLGNDPLGETYSRLRSRTTTYSQGAVYTPRPIVEAMVQWSRQTRIAPRRIVDPGTGSGRFLLHAGRAFPHAELMGVEIDPVAATLARANLAVLGMNDRASIHVGDYRNFHLDEADGPTLFLGNPPYVRHHLIPTSWKKWLTERARAHGLQASQLAGLHAHFYLATAHLSKPGDIGAFITSAEWLDVNYGTFVRKLLADELGLTGLYIIEPEVLAFEGVATTAVISTFHVGSNQSSVYVNRISDLDELGTLESEKSVSRTEFSASAKWTNITRLERDFPAAFIELGELCRVSRGQVTGCNKFWIAGAHSEGLIPEAVLHPTVTRAKELLRLDQPLLIDASALRRVIDLPPDLGVFPDDVRERIMLFLRQARKMGVHEGYIARHRPNWYSVRLYPPAPIVATYMARRPPRFVHNRARARHLNIAHGLYPREPLSTAVLTALTIFLNQSTSVHDGRTYAGGLVKFEPGEMERIRIPPVEWLADGSYRSFLGS